MPPRFIIALLTVLLAGAGALAQPGSGGQTTLTGRPLRAPDWSEAYRRELELDLAVALAQFDTAPEREDSYIWLGRRYGYLGRYDEAIAVFDEGLERFPESYRLYRFRGRHRARNRDFAGAIADYEAGIVAMESQPDSFEPDGVPNRIGLPISTYRSNLHYYLGQTLFATGDWQRMLLELDLAPRSEILFAKDDLNVAIVFWKTLALRKLGRDTEAWALLATIPDHLDLIENDGYLAAVKVLQGKTPTAEVEASGDSLSRFALGMQLRFNGSVARSDQVLNDVVDANPLGYWPAEAELTRGAVAAPAARSEQAAADAERPSGPGRVTRADSMLPLADPWNVAEDYLGIAVADAKWTIDEDFPGTKLILDGRYTFGRSTGPEPDATCNCKGRTAPEKLVGTLDAHLQWGEGETSLEYARLSIAGVSYQWDYEPGAASFGRLRDTLEWGVVQGGKDDPLGVRRYAELTVIRGSRAWYRRFSRLPLYATVGMEMSGGYSWADSVDETYQEVSNLIVGSAFRASVASETWGDLYVQQRVVNGFTLSSPARGGAVSREARFRFGYTRRMSNCLVMDLFVEKRSFNFSDPQLPDLYTKSRRIGAELGCSF